MTVLGWDDSHPADKQSSNDKCEGSVAGAGMKKTLAGPIDSKVAEAVAGKRVGRS